MEIILQRLQKLRLQFEYQPTEVASYLKISEEAYLDLEEGRSELSLVQINQLCDLYGIQEYDLFNEDQEPKSILGNLKGVNPQDMGTIANFNRLVFNYMKIKRLSDS